MSVNTAQPTLVWGLQLPRKMLNSITAAVGKQEAGRDRSQLPGATSPRSKSRLCSQFHVNLEKRQKTDCWSPCSCDAAAGLALWHARPWATWRVDLALSLLSTGGSAPWGIAHTTFIPSNLSEHPTVIQRCLLKTSFGIKPWPEGICSTENSTLTLNPFFPSAQQIPGDSSPSLPISDQQGALPQPIRCPCHHQQLENPTLPLSPRLAWLFPTSSELELLYIITAPLFIIIP